MGDDSCWVVVGKLRKVGGNEWDVRVCWLEMGWLRGRTISGCRWVESVEFE